MKKKIRLFDERGFLFGKLSVIDILAVLLVVGLALMVIIRFGITGEDGLHLSDTGTAPVSYELEVIGVRQFMVDAISIGDELYASESGAAMGRIVDKRVEDNYTATTMLDGAVEFVPKEGYYDVYLTVEADSTAGAGGYYLDGAVELLANMSIQVRTQYAVFYGRVNSIN